MQKPFTPRKVYADAMKVHDGGSRGFFVIALPSEHRRGDSWQAVAGPYRSQDEADSVLANLRRASR